MTDNIKPGEVYTFVECPTLPFGGEIRVSGAVDYLRFVDNVSRVIKEGGRARRSAIVNPAEADLAILQAHAQ